MKRHKQLYESVCAFDNLLRATQQARRGKRFVPSVAHFLHRQETELLHLQDELLTQTYRPGPYHTFIVRDPKPRLISAAPFRDRVVHHALCNVIEPIFDRTFIHDSYACRKDKGTHAAVDRLTHFMQNNDFVLKCDIRKYFASVDHAILKELLRRKIGCPQTLWLTDRIIDHSNPQEEVGDTFPGDDLFTPIERPRGLPIGNQTSQFFANVTLNPLDHFLKEELGCRAYIRYVDDFVVLSDDKETLRQTREAIADFLAAHLRLRLHSTKQTVTPVTEGCDFLGYRVYPTHRRLRKSSGFRFARRLRRMQADYQRGKMDLKTVRQRIMSWMGHASHADTWGLRMALLSGAVFSRA